MIFYFLYTRHHLSIKRLILESYTYVDKAHETHIASINTDWFLRLVSQSYMKHCTVLKGRLCNAMSPAFTPCTHAHANVYVYVHTSVMLIFSPENILSLISSTPRALACTQQRVRDQQRNKHQMLLNFKK